MQQRMTNRSQVAQPRPYPAPVGGWNARDALSAMDPTQAVTLDNFFPGFGSVDSRRGFEAHSTGMGSSQVQTLAVFVDGASTKMIAACSGHLWDVSSAGTATAISSGYTLNQWQTAQMDDTGGSPRLALVNGTDAPQIYTGSSASAMTVSATGLTVTNLINVHVYKSRAYYVEKNSSTFWYSATNAIGGALTPFKLGRLSGVGGNLLAIDTWSIDAGNGPADVICFFMSSGDVIVYSGSNPGDANDWALVGMYKIGEPIGYRCTQKVGSELYVITKSGYVPLSSAAKLGLIKQSVAISDNVRGAVQKAAESVGNLFGWQALLYPRGNYALFNVPISSTLFQQHVVNTETGAWCRFRDQNFACWAVYNGRLYGGGNAGTVYLADEGFDDAGMPIKCVAETAWNYLGAPGILKQVTMTRVLGKTTGGDIPYSLGVAVDYGSALSSASGAAESVDEAPWDTSPWDTTSWPSESAVFGDWTGASGLGDAVSVRFRIQSSNTQFSWFSTTYAFIPGGIL